jgi:hypothetical protein
MMTGGSAERAGSGVDRRGAGPSRAYLCPARDQLFLLPVSIVNGHRFLPTGGHLIPHWWPSFLPAGGHQISPPVAIVSPQRGVGLVFR